LFLYELHTCLQSFILTRPMEHGENKFFSQRGMHKFTNKGQFLTIEKIPKNFCIEIPDSDHMYLCFFYT
jgi:hypothetical protein